MPNLTAEQVPQPPSEPIRWLRFFFLYLKLLAPVWQISVAVLALGAGIFFAQKVIESDVNLSQLVFSLLGRRVQLAPHEYTGLETYLLSSIRAPSKDFSADDLAAIRDTVGEIKQAISRGPTRSSARAASALAIQPTGAKGVDEQYLTLPGIGNAHLFVPGIVIPGVAGRTLRPGDVAALLRSHEQLPYDIRMAISISPLLKQLDGTSINGETTVQTYYLSETGVLLIRKSGIEAQDTYYNPLLKAYRFFPERPYFWAATSTLGSGHDPPPEVYIDTGGNGPIRTYCALLHKLPAYVLCMDVIASKEALDALSWRLGLLETESYPVTCTSSKNDKDCAFDPKPPPGHSDDDLQWLTGDIAKNAGQVFGNVNMSPCDEPCENFQFAMPLKTRLSGDGYKIRFAWAAIDEGKVQRAQWWDTCIAGVLFAISACALFLLVQRYVHDVRRQKKLLEEVYKVMANATVPFAWTDEKNEFVEANKKFIEVLGYANFNDLSGANDKRKRQFRDLLTPDSRRTYDRILDQSLRGEKTDEYEAQMIRSDGKILDVVIHGAAVNVASLFTVSPLPHRFGIILRYHNDV